MNKFSDIKLEKAENSNNKKTQRKELPSVQSCSQGFISSCCQQVYSIFYILSKC